MAEKLDGLSAAKWSGSGSKPNWWSVTSSIHEGLILECGLMFSAAAWTTSWNTLQQFHR